MNESPRHGQDSNQSPRQDPYGGSKPPDPSPKPPQKIRATIRIQHHPENPNHPRRRTAPRRSRNARRRSRVPRCRRSRRIPAIRNRPAAEPQVEARRQARGNQGPSGPAPSGPDQGSTSSTPDQTDTTAPTQGESGGGATSSTGTTESNGSADSSKPTDPVAAQIAALKKDLDERQKKILALEPLKASVGDITQRIQALENMVDGQAAAATSYKDSSARSRSPGAKSNAHPHRPLPA